VKNKIIIPLIFTVFAVTGAGVRAIPPPCTDQELLDSSDYAVQGTVIKIECGKPYDSGECRPNDDSSAGFMPETVSKCTASVKVEKNIKGKYGPGDTAPVPFLKVVEECRSGSHIIPGSPKADLKENTQIRYYNSGLCRYSNLETPANPAPVTE
jgi:hypothetical protein